ncbi:MAG: dienelactone hydrolase family protein [Chloroflexi bacterium]|nr:dienelactone hydrolase family protein [Chloroflexota bacterium]
MSEDGTRFSAFHARAAKTAEPTGAGILILPDVRGLHPYFEELAARFAERGIHALAIDYFGRTAGLAPRAADFDFRAHVPQTRWATLAMDIRAGIAFLRSPDGGAATSLFTTGFCVGGRLTLVSATMGLDLAGVIGFYGWPVGTSRDIPAPVDLVGAMKAPVLAIWGGADEGITPDVSAAFDRALDGAGVEHRSITYARAPHSFFDRKAEEFAEASSAAWDEALRFIAANTGR